MQRGGRNAGQILHYITLSGDKTGSNIAMTVGAILVYVVYEGYITTIYW